MVPFALLHHQPAAEGEAEGAGEWGPSWRGTLLAQEPRQAGLGLLSLCGRVVEAACAIQPHLLEATEHQTLENPVPTPSESSSTFLESPLPLLFLPQVQMVKMSELKEHLPRECLPEYLGGSLKLDPLSWNCRFLPQQNGHPDPLDELILVPLAAPKDNGSVHVPGPKSLTLQELLDHVSHKQKRGIYEEYEDIRRRSPAGTFVCSL